MDCDGEVPADERVTGISAPEVIVHDGKLIQVPVSTMAETSDVLQDATFNRMSLSTNSCTHRQDVIIGQTTVDSNDDFSIPDDTAQDGGSTDISVPSSVFLEEQAKLMCTQFSTLGEETLFLTVNLNQKSSTYIGSSLGHEFICNRMDILEQFYNFCTKHYSNVDSTDIEKSKMALSADISTQTENILELKTNTSYQTENILELETILSSQAENLPELETNRSSQAEHLHELETNISSKTENLPELEVNISSQTENLPELETNISSLTDTVSELETNISSQTENNSELETDISSQTDNNSELVTNISMQTADILGLHMETDNISKSASKVSDQTGDSSKKDSAFKRKKSSINKNKTPLNVRSQSVDSVNEFETKKMPPGSRPVTRSSSKSVTEKEVTQVRKSSRKILNLKGSNSPGLNLVKSKTYEKKERENKPQVKTKTDDKLENQKMMIKEEKSKELSSQILTPRRSSTKRQIKTPSWIQSFVVGDLSGKKNLGKKDEKNQQVENENEVDENHIESYDSEMEVDDSDNDVDYNPGQDSKDFDQAEDDIEISENEDISAEVKIQSGTESKLQGIKRSRPEKERGKITVYDLKCYICGVVFGWHKNLKRHLKNKHNASIKDNIKPEGEDGDLVGIVGKNDGKERKFKCHVCSSAYFWKKNLKVHLKRAHNLVLENDLDKQKNENPDNLSDDGENDEGIKPDSHVRKRIFKCYQCKRGFYWKRNLKQHLKGRHGIGLDENIRPENYVSEDESIDDRNDNDMTVHKQHQKSKGRFKCDFCNYVFRWKNNLRRHLSSKHQIGHEKAREILTRITRETGLYIRKSYEDFVHDGKDGKGETVDSSTWMKVELDNEKVVVTDEEESSQSKSTESEKTETVSFSSNFTFCGTVRRPFICKICNMAFKYRSNLWRHARQHPKAKLKIWKFSCPECDRGFDTDIAVKSHLRTFHKKLNVFNCEKCHSRMHTITAYRRHVKKCNGPPSTDNFDINNKTQINKKLTCSMCLQVVKSQKAMDAHMEQHRNDHDATCRICGKKFVLAKRLQIHMQTHSKEMKLSCIVCDKKFSFPCNLGRHLQYVHKDMRPFCKKCAAIFETESELKEHLKTEHKIAPNMCKYCGQVILDPVELKKHKSTHKPSLVCEICGMTFERHGLLKEHLVLHTDQYPLACDMCDMRFQLSKDLVKHQVQAHGIKKCQCDECGRVFSLPQTLKKHLLTHTNIYAYPCKHCSRQFRSTDGLKYHMLLKHKLSDNVEDYKRKVFKCEHCGKLMGQKHVYERHTRMHTGEKPYKCDICDTSFPVKARLNQHMKRHNTAKQFSCDICNMDFWEQGSLKHHLQTRKHKEAESCTDNIIIHSVQPNETVQIAGNADIDIPMLVDGATKEYHVELVKPEPNEIHEVQEVMYQTGGDIEVGVPYQVIQIPNSNPDGEQQYIYIRIPDTGGDTNTNIVYDIDTSAAVRSILHTE